MQEVLPLDGWWAKPLKNDTIFKMWVKLLLLFFVASFLLRTDLSFDQDLGRHLKLGEIISRTWTIPKVNLFSYTNPDFPFINTHWLFEVLVFWSNQTIGVQPLIILKILIILLSVWLILKIIPKQNTTTLLPVGFIFLHVLRERLELRPEIFSFLFTALTLYILHRFLKNKSKLIFLLPLLQLLWVNTHIYFFVGFLLQAIFLLAHPRRVLIFVFIFSVISSLINPHGLQGVLYPLNVTKNYGYTIVENQTMFFLENINFKDANFLFVKISTAIVILSVLVSFLRRTFQIKNILLSLTGVILALLNVRSFPYLVFLSLPAVVQNLGVVKPTSFIKILSFIFGGLLALESFFYLSGQYYKFRDDQHQAGLSFTASGKKALDFVLDKDLPQPIFNNFDIGSYIIYRGYPKYRVFVDGRPEAYPATFFSGIYIPAQSDYQNFKEIERLWGFKTVIFSHTDQTPWGRNFLQNVVKDKDWSIVYIDDFMLILVIKGFLDQKNLQAVDLSKLEPGDFKFDSHLSYLKLSLFLFLTQNRDSATKFAQKALQLSPQSPVANAIFGNVIQNKFFW